jgi:hypothetical protein
MESALREVIVKLCMSVLQLMCMHDLGITISLSLSLPDKESLIDTPQWRSLLKAKIQNSKRKLDDMVKKQSRQREHQSKRKGSKVIPGSPLGHLWVPDFWLTSVGPRRKQGHGGSRKHFGRTWIPVHRSPHKTRQQWVPGTSFLFCVWQGNQIKLSTFNTVTFRVQLRPDRFHARRSAPPLHS